MHIHLCCVGKLKERFYEEGCGEYSKRLSRYCRLTITEAADEKAPEELSLKEQVQVKEREGKRILSAIGPKEHVIALAIGGKKYTSEKMAERIGVLESQGKEVCFVIGGSLGLSEEVLRRADETLSLSDLTLPHRLARLVLLEQLYRCFKILHHEAYHK